MSNNNSGWNLMSDAILNRIAEARGFVPFYSHL